MKGEWRTSRKETNKNFEGWGLYGGLEEKAKFLPLGHQILLNWSNSERIKEVLQNDENAYWRSIFQLSGFSEIFGKIIVFILRKKVDKVISKTEGFQSSASRYDEDVRKWP